MSLTGLNQKIHQLSPQDQEVSRRELDQAPQLDDDEETPEMLAAIDEGLRSLRKEPTCRIEDLREDLRR